MLTELADEQLQQKVQDELHRAPRLDVSDIGVTVEQGIVTLKGYVPDAAQLGAASAAVHRVPGVRAIVDDLEVRPGGRVLADEPHIAQEVLNLLDRGLGSAARHVQVVVHEGRVRLEGTVDNPADRDAAESMAGEIVLGWGAVENAIQVRAHPTA